MSKKIILLDVSDQKCPYAMASTKNKLSLITGEQELHVTTTDQSYQIDLIVYVRKKGYKILKSWCTENKYHFIIQKSKED